jgi:hypothetical protein
MWENMYFVRSVVCVQRNREHLGFMMCIATLVETTKEEKKTRKALHHNTRTPTVKLVGKAAYANRKSVGD